MPLPVLARDGSRTTECTGRARRGRCANDAAFATWRDALKAAPAALLALGGGANVSCAVVGASGGLRNARHGAEIDAHDLVLRVNAAPIRGFMAIVGRRTTASVINMDTFSSDRQYVTARRGGAPRDYGGAPRLVSCHVPFDGRCTDARLAQLFSNASVGTAFLLSKDVARGARARFGGVRQRSPTTGMLAIEAALRLCATVRLFGFADGRCPQQCYHYYGRGRAAGCYTEGHFFDADLRASGGFHDFLAQARELRRLNATRQLEWVLDDCAPG